MRTCKLYIRNMDTDRQFFEAKVTETRTYSNGKVERRVIDSIETRSPDTTCQFLVRNGVQPTEVAVADIELHHNEHNCAHFGVNGSFMYTEYEGSVH